MSKAEIIEMIDAFDGRQALSQLLNVRTESISQWIARGKIPDAWLIVMENQKQDAACGKSSERLTTPKRIVGQEEVAKQIDALGGAQVLAKRLNINTQAISRWIERGSIPVRWLMAIHSQNCNQMAGRHKEGVHA